MAYSVGKERFGVKEVRVRPVQHTENRREKQIGNIRRELNTLKRGGIGEHQRLRE